MSLDRKQRSLQNLKRISELLDSKFTGPFGIKFGLDPILGLIPGVGDIVTTFISIYIILNAYYMEVGISVLIRMCVNVLLENVIDMIPFLGNLFDFVWRSNKKNLELLERYIEFPTRQRFISRFVVGVLFLIFLSLLTYSFYLSALLLRYVAGLVFL